MMFALRFIDSSLWRSLVVQAENQAPTSGPDLLAQVGNSTIIDRLFEEYSFHIFAYLKACAGSGTAPTTIYETPRSSSSKQTSARDQDFERLHRAICIADSYYIFNAFRSTWTSRKNSSALLEGDEKRQQKLVDFLVSYLTRLASFITSFAIQDIDIKNYQNTRIYDEFVHFRDDLNHALARRRRIVPSSFFVRNIERLDIDPIGCGGFSDVWRGCMHGTSLVALKILRSLSTTTKMNGTEHQVRHISPRTMHTNMMHRNSLRRSIEKQYSGK